MDFFSRQSSARKRTALLIFYFIAAIVAVTVVINIAVFSIINFGGFLANGLSVVTHSPAGSWFAGPHWIWTTAIVLAVIGIGSFVSFVRLADGGRAVARMMDARPVDLNSSDPRIKRFVNVVEEMAIASGAPVPELYIQPGETGINAYVAGFKIREAVMVVTEGALAELNRDELQGVVGHEFSHILNGDMRINVRLIAVLAGVTLIGQIGDYLISPRRVGRTYRIFDTRSRMGSIVLGAALFVLGYLGLMFGRLIKAAISRQREYLADASSVQFTRNPDGIASALHKIDLCANGSYLSNAHAEDMSHMCFGETVRFKLSSWYATHPSITERIEAVHPRFDPTTVSQSNADSAPNTAEESAAGIDATPDGRKEDLFAAVISTQILMQSIGNPSKAQFDLAKEIHERVSTLRDLVHEPLGARAVVYALIITDTRSVSAGEVAAAAVVAESSLSRKALDVIVSQVGRLTSNDRFALLEMTFPALGRLHVDQKETFVATLKQLIRLDKRYSLFEFVVYTVLAKYLFPRNRLDQPEYKNFAAVESSIRIIISLYCKLAYADSAESQALYARVIKTFGFAEDSTISAETKPRHLTRCLEQLDCLSPILKKSVINACVDCVLSDRQVTDKEILLLRATSMALDCPMPPFRIDKSNAPATVRAAA